MEIDFEGCFGDRRLQLRAKKMISELFSKCVHSIRQILNDKASQQAWYRFLRNDNTTEEEEITKQITDFCGIATRGRVVLSIQDTTEINLYSHKNRIHHNESIGKTAAPNMV